LKKKKKQKKKFKFIFFSEMIRASQSNIPPKKKEGGKKCIVAIKNLSLSEMVWKHQARLDRVPPKDLFILYFSSFSHVMFVLYFPPNLKKTR
jgi:hypothetical protein